jgi:radical SAM superfamily enzyme YgiQ (UPF0313 family)
MKKILLVYPRCPEMTFWGLKKILWSYLAKRTAFSPLGLLIVSSLLPKEWNKKLVDLNCESCLLDEDILWADMVMISAMIIQEESTREIIQRCKALGKTVVVGGALFSGGYNDFVENKFVLNEEALIAAFPGVDHFILGEAEATLAPFLKDLEIGVPRKIYFSNEKPDLSLSPVPDWSLINLKDYTTAAMQFSRFCPYDCEFCCIHELFGRKMRVKMIAQIIAELNVLFAAGYRGSIFFVDDNFVGPRAEVKRLLSALMEWQREHNFPFDFLTQASVDMAEDEGLMAMMRFVGFKKVFLGIETTNIASLKQSNKMQNVRCDLTAAVKKIHSYGIQVMAGMIVGFDQDTPEIFEELFKFLQEAGIVTAMVNMLTALPGTKLWVRMKEEGRLLSDSLGDSVELNFEPKMGREALLKGYCWLQKKLYQPKYYYQRLRQMMSDFSPAAGRKITLTDLRAFLQSLWRIGIFSFNNNWRYNKLLFLTTIFKRKMLPIAVEAAITHVHYRKLSLFISKGMRAKKTKQVCI